MKNKYFGEIIALGKLVYFEKKERPEFYTKELVKKTYDEVKEIIFNNVTSLYRKDYEDDHREVSFSFSYIASPFHSDFLVKYMKEGFFKTNDSFSDIFENGIKKHLEDPMRNSFYRFVDKTQISSLTKQIIEMKNRIVIQIDRLIMNEIVSRIKKDVIIYVANFKKEFLYELPYNVKGFVCRNFDDPDLILELSYAYEVPITTTTRSLKGKEYVVVDCINNVLYLNPNALIIKKAIEIRKRYTFELGEEPIYKSDIIKFYADLVDRRDIERARSSHWYSGIGIFRTEFLYITKGYTPSFDEQVELYKDIIEAFKDRIVQIRIPDLNDIKAIDHEEVIFTELEYIRKFTRIFHTNLLAIQRASELTDKQVTIIIPMLRMGTEINEWKDLLAGYLGDELPFNKKPKFGIMMETESAFQYYEDYRYVDTSVFGLDNLIEEAMEKSKYDDIDFEEFELQVLPDLLGAHQYFRRTGIKLLHFVSGHILRDPLFLRKLMNRGFKHFVIPMSYIKKAGEVLYQVESTRGAYAGVHAKREKAKLGIVEKEKTM